jgi:hypothetical protein
MAKESAQSGSTAESSTHGFQGSMAGLGHLLERVMLGQLTNPPDTAISVPQQQATTLAQAGPFGAADYLGVDATKSLAPGPNQAGLQTRAQLGLPERSSYMGPFAPTAADVASLGLVPPIGPESAPNKKIDKQSARLGKQEAKPQTPHRAGKELALGGKIANAKKRQPERFPPTAY